MAWPTPQEYNEAIQNPGTAFADPELRAGQPRLTPLGLPRPITGGFASVYQMHCANQRVWAVRCFLRDFGDHQARYAAISAHLAQSNLPYMVDFSFLADGIRVGGRFHPILKMQWVEGDAFLPYVERNLYVPAVLLDLAQQWVQMAQMLARAGIAHGDLQHGNVIVVRGQLKLIDYDGMYVPALAGRQSHEVGHRNYQHPQRSEALFAPDIDHFSTWIIYSSLVALAVEPALWQQLRGGDECLLFRRDDFVAPARSPALAALEQVGDARLGRLAGLLRSLLTLTPQQIPPIDGQIDLAAMRARPVAAWVRDHVTLAPPAPPASPQPAPPAAPWLADFLAPPSPVAPAAPALPASAPDVLRRARWVAAVSAAFTVAMWLLLGVGTAGLAAPAWLAALVVAGNLGHLALLYARLPEVVAWRDVRRRRQRVDRRWRAGKRALATAAHEQAYIQQIEAQQVARIDRLIAKAQAAEQAQLAARNRQYQHDRDALQVQRHRRQQEETLKIQRIETRYRERIAALDQQLGAIHLTEADARQKLLERRRQEFVVEFLGRQKIEKALITGIGPGVKDRLRQHGIVRVTDVNARRLAAVPGIGAARADLLLTWRQRVEELAWQAAPTKLDRGDERDVRRHHERLHAQLTKDRARQEQKLAQKVAAARAQAVRHATHLAAQEQQLDARHLAQVDALHQVQRARLLTLRTERTQVARQAERARAGVTHASAQLAHQQQQLTWEQASLEAEVAHFADAGFVRFMRRVFLPR